MASWRWLVFSFQFPVFSWDGGGRGVFWDSGVFCRVARRFCGESGQGCKALGKSVPCSGGDCCLRRDGRGRMAGGWWRMAHRRDVSGGKAGWCSVRWWLVALWERRLERLGAVSYTQVGWGPPRGTGPRGFSNRTQIFTDLADQHRFFGGLPPEAAGPRPHRFSAHGVDTQESNQRKSVQSVVIRVPFESLEESLDRGSSDVCKRQGIRVGRSPACRVGCIPARIGCRDGGSTPADDSDSVREPSPIHSRNRSVRRSGGSGGRVCWSVAGGGGTRVGGEGGFRD